MVFVLLVGLTIVAARAPVAQGQLATLQRQVLTTDGPMYIVTRGPGSILVRARKGDGNEREVYWYSSALETTQGTSCAQWNRGEGIDQQGAAFRISTTHGDTRTITVTRNVVFGQFSVFNFHIWNTSTTPAFHLFGQVVLTHYLGTGQAAYPLNFCARIVRRLVQFVIWRPGQPQPEWGSVSQGGSALLPAGAPDQGYTGWFAGHVVAGTSTKFTDVSINN